MQDKISRFDIDMKKIQGVPQKSFSRRPFKIMYAYLTQVTELGSESSSGRGEGGIGHDRGGDSLDMSYIDKMG